MELVLLVYRLVAKFPKEEQYGLSSQARRASVSIPSNIAEGAGRKSDKEFSHFLFISHGSSCELDTEMTLARNLSYISEEEYMEVSDKNEEVRVMLESLEQSLKV